MEGKENMERLTIKAPSGLIHLKDNTEMIVNVAIKKLSDYEDLEEQGKLLKLRCAVGDEFYCIWRNKGQNPIQKMQVKKIEIHERNGIVIQMEFVGNRGCLFRFYEDDFGKTVFLTREEAEAALKELERG